MLVLGCWQVKGSSDQLMQPFAAQKCGSQCNPTKCYAWLSAILGCHKSSPPAHQTVMNLLCMTLAMLDSVMLPLLVPGAFGLLECVPSPTLSSGAYNGQMTSTIPSCHSKTHPDPSPILTWKWPACSYSTSPSSNSSTWQPGVTKFQPLGGPTSSALPNLLWPVASLLLWLCGSMLMRHPHLHPSPLPASTIFGQFSIAELPSQNGSK